MKLVAARLWSTGWLAGRGRRAADRNGNLAGDGLRNHLANLDVDLFLDLVRNEALDLDGLLFHHFCSRS
jgi:hypothetical protein